MVPLALPMVQLVPLVSQWYHWLPMVPLVKLPMVPMGEPRTEPIVKIEEKLLEQNARACVFSVTGDLPYSRSL